MNSSSNYVPSKLLSGEAELLRARTFTRWMSRDLLQAATDFCKNIGLVPIYCESKNDRSRYLFWQMPATACCEVRSGRTREKFYDYDRVNTDRGWQLLTLHVSEEELFSAVWISGEHYETAVKVLTHFAIAPAEKRTA